MLAAVGIVAGMFVSAPSVLRRIDAIAMLPPPERPIQLDLRDLEPAPAPEPEPEPEPVKRLIDAGAPTDEPVQETDLISSQASRAQDLSDAEGDPNRPAAQEVDDFDQLAAATPAPSPPAPEVTPPMPEESPAVQEPAEPTPPPVEEKPAVEPAPAVEETGTSAPELPEPAKNEEAAKPKPEEKKVEEVVAEKPAESKPAPEPFKVAQATPPPPAPIPMQELHSEKGRKGGGAEHSGNTSFEANKHALGEYMLGVRNRVERSWRTALHLRYSGSSRTDAVIHCVIRPDGTIESVSIVDAGESLTYAVLCREAVEAAGPFAPFPFDVPEIYRTDNLEINWRFSYL